MKRHLQNDKVFENKFFFYLPSIYLTFQCLGFLIRYVAENAKVRISATLLRFGARIDSLFLIQYIISVDGKRFSFLRWSSISASHVCVLYVKSTLANMLSLFCVILSCNQSGYLYSANSETM